MSADMSVDSRSTYRSRHRPTIGPRYRRRIPICRWYIDQLSVIYRSTVGGISVNCRSTLLLKVARSYFIARRLPFIDWYISIYQPIVDRYSVNYRRSIGKVSARYRWSIDELRDISADRYIDRLSTDSWPTLDRYIDRLSTDCRPINRPTYRRTYRSRLPTVNMIQQKKQQTTAEASA